MILNARHITKQFKTPTPVTVLSDLSLSVAAGETVAITGKSGEGKTTLLHILGTLEPPTTGDLEICGEKVSRGNWARLRNQKIGFIFQAFHLLDDYTVYENVVMPAKIGHRHATAEAHELIAEVGLSHRADFPAKLLSGGEKQRVAIARALINNPDLILADEPSGNLDHTLSTQIYALLMSAAKKRKKAVVVVTHDPELAHLCETKYSLQDGKLV